MIYKARFVGRYRQEIGAVHFIETTVEGVDPLDAHMRLYDWFGCVWGLQLTPQPTPPPNDTKEDRSICH